MNAHGAPDNQQSLIYLDNAATSFPKPDCVCDAMDQYMRHNGASIGRGSHASAVAAAGLMEQCRQRIRRILDAESSDRIAFTFNCTDSLNLLLRGVLREGDRVVTTQLEHNSVLRPLTALQQQAGLDVVHVGFHPNTGRIDPADVETELKRKATKLVVLNHASNVTGAVQPAAEIIEAAHKYDSLVLLDAAQSTGHIPFSVQDLQVDLLATAGHKGLLGPLGTGLVYIRSGLDDRIQPIRCGGTGTTSESVEQPTTMPQKLESGNMNGPGIAGLNAAADWQLSSEGEAGRAAVVDGTSQLADSLQHIDGVRICCAEQFANSEHTNAGIVSFVLKQHDSREVATILEQSFGIACRAGLHCAPLVHEALNTLSNAGTVRLSVGPFTTADDIETAVAAIRQVAEVM